MKKNEKYIYRMHTKNANGWYLCIKTKPFTYFELFSVKSTGGVHKALQYARDTRDLILAVAGK